jgi:peptidylprolyl isomerase
MGLLLGLAQLQDPQDTPRYLWWMESSADWRVRTNAARALAGRATDPMVRTALLEAMDDPSTHVAVQAATALSSAEDLPPRERDALKQWVEDHPIEWRRAGPILGLLGRVGEAEFLLRWLGRWSEADPLPRTRGLGALAFVPGEAATAALLEEAASTHPRIRGTALGALARRWRVERQDPASHPRYFEAFAQGLRTGDPAAAVVAAPALADSAFLALGSVALLVAEYGKMALPDDLEGMQAVVGALGASGAREAEAFLQEVVAGSEGALRTSASRALAQLRGEEPPPSARGAGAAERTVDWGGLRALGPRPRLVLETEKGTVTLVLDAEAAPLTVQTIAGFAAEGKYNGVPFHRVVPNFVAQGGDFARQDGFGGPGFSIRSEFTLIPFERGVLGMASSGKDTEGSQFFVTHSAQPHLEGAYTAFGWVEAGMDVVDRLEEEDRVLSARVQAPGA